VRTVYPSGTTIYDPDRCYNGYTLEFEARHVPMLFDMNGNVVHAWKNVSGKGRMRLVENGHLVVITTNSTVEEYDWEGGLVWEYRPPGRPHHDLQRLKNGDTVMIYQETVPDEYKAGIENPERRRLAIRSDCIREVNPAGETVWEWHEYEHLDINKYCPTDGATDWTHTNTVQVLPENKWYEAGDERFRPGNVLISVRNQDTVYIIDRETEEVVWDYTGNYMGGLAHQHEPHMIEPSLPGAGNILIFDNGIACRRISHEGSSFILEIDPTNKEIVWMYASRHFYCPTAGVQQRLPNGNTMITSSREGRIFEVTPSGETVWEWVPDSYDPMRPNRYPYDFCPQLKALGKPDEIPVKPPKEWRHRELWRTIPI